MLVWIDPSVLTADYSADQDACAGISALFDSSRRGEHFVLSTRDTLRELSTNHNFASSTKTEIQIILSNLPSLSGITSQVKLRSVVTYAKTVVPIQINNEEWEIPLKTIGIYGIRKTVLLTEDIEDATVLEHAARQYQSSMTLPGMVSVEKSGGGGSGTPKVFENHIKNEKRWCLCITDSDRISPNEEMDVTAKKCFEISKTVESVASHIDLVSREVENVLPIAFLNEAIAEDHKDSWVWYVDNFLRIRPDAHGFTDIKLGISRKKVSSYPKLSQRRTYWESVSDDLAKASVIKASCSHGDKCEHNADEACKCFISYGFGGKLLVRVNQNLSARTPHNSEKMIRSDQNQENWRELGRRVFEWGFSTKKRRI